MNDRTCLICGSPRITETHNISELDRHQCDDCGEDYMVLDGEPVGSKLQRHQAIAARMKKPTSEPLTVRDHLHAIVLTDEDITRTAAGPPFGSTGFTWERSRLALVDACRAAVDAPQQIHMPSARRHCRG